MFSMILFHLFALCISKNDYEKTSSKAMSTAEEIKKLTNHISLIHFDSNDLTEQIDKDDKDAVNLALEETKIVKSSNFFSKLLKNVDDNYLKCKCNNCIKVLSQNAVFIFRAIRKSTINTVKFYHSTKQTCQVKNIQLTFYNDDFINYTTEVFHLLPKLNIFHFNQNITFENVHVNATSSDTEVLCLGGFSLLFR